MSGKRQAPETPDESIPQDPGIPGPGTKESEWPPETGTEASTSERGLTRDARERKETTVSEASGQRTPRHRADRDRKTER